MLSRGVSEALYKHPSPIFSFPTVVAIFLSEHAGCPAALQSRLVNTIAFALHDCFRLMCATQYVFLLTSDDSLQLRAQDLSLKLAGTLGIAGKLHPLTKPNLLCYVLKALIFS